MRNGVGHRRKHNDPQHHREQNSFIFKLECGKGKSCQGTADNRTDAGKARDIDTVPQIAPEFGQVLEKRTVIVAGAVTDRKLNRTRAAGLGGLKKQEQQRIDTEKHPKSNRHFNHQGCDCWQTQRRVVRLETGRGFDGAKIASKPPVGNADQPKHHQKKNPGHAAGKSKIGVLKRRAVNVTRQANGIKITVAGTPGIGLQARHQTHAERHKNHRASYRKSNFTELLPKSRAVELRRLE